MDLTSLQKDYAQLLLCQGLALEKGQLLVLDCPVERADFARIVAAQAYDLGCREVVVNWEDDALARMKYLRGSDEIFDTVHPWTAELFERVSAEGAAWLALTGRDPENLAGVDADRIRRAQAASGAALAGFRRRETNNEFPWCVAGVATCAWAEKVYPGSADALAQLWTAIFTAARVDGKNAVENWRAHSDTLRRRCAALDALDIVSLHYENALGTDLTVELPQGHFWAGGMEKCKNGRWFSANIPTEEVYTLPVRTGVEGVVCAAKPLSLNGTIVKDLRFVLEEGKIVSATATQGEAVLRDAIAVDEGASYLGEVALVPYDSAICRSGVLFYNTLFDENAACHFAFGEAYPCLRGGENMSAEELRRHGANRSMTHVDFMVGTPDLSITALCRDGTRTVVFRDGNFAL